MRGVLGAVEKGQGVTPVELDRCAMEGMRAEKRGGGGGVEWGYLRGEGVCGFRCSKGED